MPGSRSRTDTPGPPPRLVLQDSLLLFRTLAASPLLVSVVLFRATRPRYIPGPAVRVVNSPPPEASFHLSVDAILPCLRIPRRSTAVAATRANFRRSPDRCQKPSWTRALPGCTPVPRTPSYSHRGNGGSRCRLPQWHPSIG